MLISLVFTSFNNINNVNALNNNDINEATSSNDDLVLIREKAERYLNGEIPGEYDALFFSKHSLISILIRDFNNSSVENVVNDIETIKPNLWKLQAEKGAEYLLKEGIYSQSRLIQHLKNYYFFTSNDLEGVDNPTFTDWSKEAEKGARNLLKEGVYSQSGLIKHLKDYYFFKSENLDGVANPTFADWSDQAARFAIQVLERDNFSRDGLINYLLAEGFTREQAEYGTDSTQTFWKYQAVEVAKRIGWIETLSKQATINKLIDEYLFISEDVDYAIDKLDINWKYKAYKLANKKYYKGMTLEKLKEELEIYLFEEQEIIFATDEILKIKEAREAVEKVEGSIDQLDLDNAFNLVEKLVDEEYKSEFILRLYDLINKYPVLKRNDQIRNDEAVLKAQELIESNCFSKDKLKQKLVYEYDFTCMEAEYAVNNAEIIWEDVALLKAQELILSNYYSRLLLKHELIYNEGFTAVEADFAVINAGIKWL